MSAPQQHTQEWWKVLQPQLDQFAQGAGYDDHQRQALISFFHNNVLPRLGPADPGRWTSLLTSDGTPLEYSWKWNETSDSAPDIRYCIEAIGEKSGTATDPLNYREAESMLRGLHLPQLDLTWSEYFAESLLEPDNAKVRSALGTSTFIAFEHLEQGVVVKTYFLPPSNDTITGGIKEEPPTFAMYARVLAVLDPRTDAMDAVVAFVKESNQVIVPDMLAVDCIEPSRSRIKLYIRSDKTSFESVLAIMTLGRRIPISDQQVRELRAYFTTFLDLPADYRDADEVAVKNPFRPIARPFDNYGQFVYNFDIQPAKALPDVKFYIPVGRFTSSDDAAANGLIKYLGSVQRDKYASGFRDVLDEIYKQHGGDKAAFRAQTWLSAAFLKTGGLSFTSYLNPGMYHEHLMAAGGWKPPQSQ